MYIHVVIIVRLVADTDHGDDAPLMEYRQVQVPCQLHVSLGESLLERTGLLVPVGHDGAPLPHRLAPKAGFGQPIV